MNSSRKTAALCAAAGLALLVTACGNDSNTTTTPTQTPAAPTTSERYVATIAVGGSGFFSFLVSQYGTVNVTLNAVSGLDDPSVGLGLSLGVPSGFGCSATSTVTASAGVATPQLTGTYPIGVYCVRIADAGNLTAPMTFDLTIAHP
jgi:hypothetical protein